MLTKNVKRKIRSLFISSFDEMYKGKRLYPITCRAPSKSIHKACEQYGDYIWTRMDEPFKYCVRGLGFQSARTMEGMEVLHVQLIVKTPLIDCPLHVDGNGELHSGDEITIGWKAFCRREV